jgi:hypothetical protein
LRRSWRAVAPGRRPIERDERRKVPRAPPPRRTVHAASWRRPRLSGLTRRSPSLHGAVRGGPAPVDTAPSRARCSAGKAREATRYQRNVGERAFGEDNAPFPPTSTSEASSRRDTESSRTAWECGRSVPRRGSFIFDNRIREHADIGRVDRGRRRSRPTRDREARQRPSARLLHGERESI